MTGVHIIQPVSLRTVTMIYNHVLNTWIGGGSLALWTAFEAWKGGYYSDPHKLP
jgi:hypothetical protein